MQNGLPEEFLIVKDREHLHLLGRFIQAMFLGFLKKPGKVHTIKRTRLIVAFDPGGHPDEGLTVSFKQDRVFIECGIKPGAKMRNAEFGSFFNMVHTVSREVVFGAEDYMWNARGENISTRYRPEPQCDICSQSSIGWYKEHMNQNGPIKP